MRRKRITSVTLNLFALSLICTQFFSCLDSESTKEKTLKLLTSDEWHISSVTYDGNDESDMFTGMTLTFTKETYTSVNGDPIWASSGLWAFMGEFTEKDLRSFRRDDDLLVKIEQINKNNLTLVLEWNSDFLEGRTNSIQGELVFKFTH